ncbi:MAG: ErfK/YbiS/YcfS/YnhG family protein, partial [Candidatus Adlerbacteria bacterium]|nr:ErfK/YbiS/YcfS/YnhG family protein [Candidatus Adlerbacteria bacterium]
LLALFAVSGSLLAHNQDVPPHTNATLVPVDTQTAQVFGLESVPLTEPNPTLQEYFEVTDGCDIHYAGPCVNVRSGPGIEYPAVLKLRNGIVLKIAETVVADDGSSWYKVAFDSTVRYRERVTSDWYVAADVVRTFDNTGDQALPGDSSAASTKKIIVRRGEQMLYAYEDDVLFMQEPISTGLELTPTPRGTFTIFRKTPSRYMQGPIPDISDQYYDLPGVPWDLYFTYQGGAIHGAYWHDNFGQPWSHGCVNLPPEKAKQLYEWADVGTKVVVVD